MSVTWPVTPAPGCRAGQAIRVFFGGGLAHKCTTAGAEVGGWVGGLLYNTAPPPIKAVRNASPVNGGSVHEVAGGSGTRCTPPSHRGQLWGTNWSKGWGREML